MWHGKLHPSQLVSKVISNLTTGPCSEKCLYQIYMFYRHRHSHWVFIGALQGAYSLLAVFLGIWEHPEVLGGQTEVWVVTTLLFLSTTRDHVWRRIHPDHPVWSSCRCSDPQVWLNLLLMDRASFRAWSSCPAFCFWRCSCSVLPADYWSMSLGVASFIVQCPSWTRTEAE